MRWPRGQNKFFYFCFFLPPRHMGRSYPKEAYSIGTSQNQQGTGQQAYAPPNPMATTPTQQMPANPQLYNPQTFGIQSQQAQGSGVVPPTNTPATPVSFASPTTVATAPALDPMPETDITANFKKPTHQTGSAPPPFNPAVVNSGPRHSPPPAVDQPNGNDQQPTTNTANNPPQQQLRGKRILQPEPKNPALASRSPVSAYIPTTLKP